MSTLKKDLPSNHETRISLIENNHFHMCKVLERIETSLNNFKYEYQQDMNNNMRKLELKLETLDNRLWTNFIWMIGSITIPICTSMLIYIAREIFTYFGGT